MPCGLSYSVEEVGEMVSNWLGNFCCWHLFPPRAYCMLIATVGLITTTLDIHRVLADGPKLSNRVWPMRRDSGHPLSNEAERDVKLVTAVIEWTVYFCLLIGAHYGTLWFVLPWLIIRLFILVSSAVVLCVKLVQQKPIEISTLGTIGELLGLHNFLYGACFYKKLNNLSPGLFSWFKK